ncbi:metallophosphoesterase family protein [Desulforamulus aquiferis]|uniref:Phosphoesterase n=1 Tax=Desulforamulus aquiferis TaxID=1397668 RepID=A0AAW7ZF66_9FIRM|nr:metallophosphoesterase family protein [Desulforamulus aquiferis]MDO7787656.1 metallophosphoesterase family protein [Desulforamulus aquiferis]RYD05976.1 hypothetical protein N752_06945 [Desulforamulus aquiferis]
MKLAIFSDVHSNILGFRAVLQDMANKKVDHIYCAGDLVGYGPRPNEVIELIRQTNIPTVMGNYDDAIGNTRFICGCDYKSEQALKLGEASIRWTNEHTSEENKLWLRQLPHKLAFTMEGMKFLMVHGSPRQLNEYLFENIEDHYFEELISESACDILLCGHTHLPYYKKVSNGQVINVGSVGKPKHGNPNVTYVLLNLEAGKMLPEIVEVSYDFEHTAMEIEQFGLPKEFAEIIRTGNP